MGTEPVCPRCGRPVVAPRHGAGEWRCALHGAVEPLRVLPGVDAQTLDQVGSLAVVPVWVPHPVLPGWTVSGAAYAGEDRVHAVVVACAGPAPRGGTADLVLVAEEPGVGVGAGYAGLPDPDPGPAVTGGRASKVTVGGHSTALWPVRGPEDRWVVVGEAGAVWLWILAWPAEAGDDLAANLTLHDLRERVPPGLPFGGTSSRLVPPRH